MVSPASANKHKRRTQAERRAATHTAVLDAAIGCLVEYGYAKTTTRRIARRAGVSPGALQHHFASKAALLGELVGYIRAKSMSEMFAEGLPSTRSMRKRHELLLDRMWRIYRGPLFTALIELGIGARTEPELLQHIAVPHDETARLNAMAAPILFPEHAGRAELIPLIVSGQSTMRGLALLGLAGEADPDPLWPATRAHIMAMTAQVLGDPQLAPRRSARA
ncbi:MAG: TetR/AcrR family transcriptional regulator [Solirubrobacterales bacterium]